MFSSTRDQRIGDMVAGTVVVREREAEAPEFSKVFAAPVSDPALRRSFKPVDFTASLNSLTDAEIQVVENVSAPPLGSSDVPRQWMAWRVSLPILYKLRPTYDLDTFTYEGFLEELTAPLSPGAPISRVFDPRVMLVVTQVSFQRNS